MQNYLFLGFWVFQTGKRSSLLFVRWSSLLHHRIRFCLLSCRLSLFLQCLLDNIWYPHTRNPRHRFRVLSFQSKLERVSNFRRTSVSSLVAMYQKVKDSIRQLEIDSRAFCLPMHRLFLRELLQVHHYLLALNTPHSFAQYLRLQRFTHWQNGVHALAPQGD